MKNNVKIQHDKQVTFLDGVSDLDGDIDDGAGHGSSYAALDASQGFGMELKILGRLVVANEQLTAREKEIDR